MTGTTAGKVTSAADSEAVAQVVLRERQTRDRGWYDEMAACFSAEATISMSWFTGSAADFIATTRDRTTDGVWGRHRLSPPTIRIEGNRAWAELPLAIEFAVHVGGVPADLVSYCRSQYRVVRTPDGWRIAGITSIYERDALGASLPGRALDLAAGAFMAFRPSYRCLAWYFDGRGEPLPDDLLGDDRPGPVAEQYRQELEWLARPQ